TSAQIVPECMKVLNRITYPEQFPGNTLLEQMIESGKRLLFMDAMLPQTEDWLKIGYSKEQYDYVVKNEAHIWAAIIENRILFTTDGKLIRSFMADGPFTAEFSKEAPARLGEWLGWQIVRKYFENQPDVTFQEVMTETDAQKILTKSGYKPEK
ncbi:MAG: gliding motility lipoprotein GldB, partial [Bacteroidetes bacterium]|nr:gliding motility lipoprotein GldB [Bacteroidota bacterium]